MAVRKAAAIILASVTLLLSACTLSTDNDAGMEDRSDEPLLSKDEFERMYYDTSDLIGRRVELSGIVVSAPVRYEDGVSLQLHVDPRNGGKFTMVHYASPDFQADNGTYVRVAGQVKDMFVGENLYGAPLSGPIIAARTIEKIDYITAMSPTLATVESGKTVDQYGYVMKLVKIEFAPSETRLYLSITNNTEDTIVFDSDDAKIVQDGTQYEPIINREADYPEIPLKILPGVTAEGIVLFGKLNPNGGDVRLYAEGYPDNLQTQLELDFKPFVFE